MIASLGVLSLLHLYFTLKIQLLWFLANTFPTLLSSDDSSSMTDTTKDSMSPQNTEGEVACSEE